jgi:hypothetical protein
LKSIIPVKTTDHVDDKWEVKIQLPENPAPRKYELLIVINEKILKEKVKKPFKFASYDYHITKRETFSRENIY